MEVGRIDYLDIERVINTEVLLSFLKKIVENFDKGDFALFLINLSLKKSKHESSYSSR